MPEHFHALIQLVTTDNPPEGYCLVYNYSGSNPTSCQLPSQGTTNNGNVVGYWYQDNVNPSFSHTASYTYDGVNRLTNAVATPFGSGTASYNLTFSYTQDGSNGQYGNMSCVTNAQTVGPCSNLSFNAANNHITTSGYTYDAAGNQTNDPSNYPAQPVHTYQWDAEGRVSTVDPGNNPTWTFTYNALGHRVQWAYGSSGAADQHLFDPEGNWLGNAGSYSLVMLGGRYFALYYGGNTLFNHVNALDSASMRTLQSGAVAEDILFYPWGDVWEVQGSGGYNFANIPYRDVTTTTDITTARFSSPNFGRWFSPDPAGQDAADPSDPQTWNMYAYARNNPTTLTDPSGERYYVCQSDRNGNQTTCADISDAQFNQFVEENKNTLIFTGNGNVLQNGTVIGSYYQYSVDATPGLIAVGKGTQMAAGPVNLLAGATMAFLGVFGPGMLASTLELPEIGGLGLGAAGRGADLGARPSAPPNLSNLSPKIQNDMAERGWAPQDIENAYRNGVPSRVVDRTAGFTPATQYVDPATGKFVVVNNQTGNVIQVSGAGFRPNPPVK